MRIDEIEIWTKNNGRIIIYCGRNERRSKRSGGICIKYSELLKINFFFWMMIEYNIITSLGLLTGKLQISTKVRY